MPINSMFPNSTMLNLVETQITLQNRQIVFVNPEYKNELLTEFCTSISRFAILCGHIMFQMYWRDRI